ncbi:MAG: hypothetical protein C4584_00190 [Armatimonadetes bacterium]|nr:MAG: hypothetical protein C4584_00190 [Armatimonadota bacterium]
MNLNIVAFAEQNLWWMIILTAYLAILLGLLHATTHFYGYKMANIVFWTVGIPVAIIFWIFQKMVTVTRHARTIYRNRRLLRETFDVSFKSRHENQVKVDKTLAGMARCLQHWFNEEERLHSLPEPDRNQDEFKITKALTKAHKANFRQAHNLAQRNGFKVRKSYKDYLPIPAIPTPTSTTPVEPPPL